MAYSRKEWIMKGLTVYLAIGHKPLAIGSWGLPCGR